MKLRLTLSTLKYDTHKNIGYSLESGSAKSLSLQEIGTFDSITHLQNAFDEPMILFLYKVNSFS